MQTFDWIVVGNGLAGAAASYELVRQGLTVLLVDQTLEPNNATRYSYGGIAYWSGTSDLTRRLGQAGIAKQRQLATELEAETHFRELDLLLTVGREDDPQAIAANYDQCAIPPQWITSKQAQELEPLLNPEAIAGAFTVRHGHVCPVALIRAYNQAFQRFGGTRLIAQVIGLARIKDQVTGVLTAEQAYPAKQVLVAAGAWSRRLLQQIGITIPLYYTQAELIETPPQAVTLRTLVMPAASQRFALEAQASRPALDSLWDRPGHEVTSPILDGGAIQFQDGHLCLGQLSRTLTDLNAPADATASEQAIRTTLGQILPALSTLPGHWHRCLVSFSRDGLPLVGPLPGVAGVHLLAGFSSPFLYLPPIAQRFAQAAANGPEGELSALKPGRFME